MESQRRDVQMFRRAERCRATVSKCSALGVEVKRQKVRASAVFLEQEDGSLQEKLDLEMRMGDGICKLLTVSTQKGQLLNAAKSLVTCNARIAAYRSELRDRSLGPAGGRAAARRRSVAGERAACPGKVAVSDIRVPLLWKHAEHFGSKGSSRRYAVFCLLKMGAAVFDTDLVVADKTMTDVSFERAAVFADARPDFELTLEVRSCCAQDPFSCITPKKLAQKFRRSLGKSGGKRLDAELNAAAGVRFHPAPPGAGYSLLARATLTLDSAAAAVGTHGLTVTGHEGASPSLPLYGSLCCRVVAQPACLTEDVITGFLSQKQTAEDRCRPQRVFCVLRGGHLLCYRTPAEVRAQVQPAAQVPINKETRVRALGPDSRETANSFSVVNPVAGEAAAHVFAADSREDLQRWLEAFWQHFYDLSRWKHCSEELMKIGVSPRKPPLFSTKAAAAVYHDMSIGSPRKFESSIAGEAIGSPDGQVLVGTGAESAATPWVALFDGGKKGRAPPPPSDSSPCSSKADKENICGYAPFARLPSHGGEGMDIQHKDIPVPFPRRFLEEKKDLRSWQQSQV